MSTYTPEVRRQALTIFALHDSRADHTKRALAELGLEVNIRTLQDWAYNKRRDEYDQIKAEVERYTRSRQADNFRALASHLAEWGFEAARQTAEALREGRIGVKELPRATRELVSAAATANDKAEELTGNRPVPVPLDLTIIAAELGAIPGVRVRLPAAESASALPELPAAPAAEAEEA